MSIHRVYFEQGAQSLPTIPHRGGAPVRVTAGTYSILDTRYSVDSDEHVVVAAGTAPTFDAASTTLTAKAGRNATDRRSMTVTSSASFAAGGQYLLEGSNGQAELVTVQKLASGTVIRTAHEIRGDYSTGALLRGVQVTATFPADPAADLDNLDGEGWIIVWLFAGMPPIRESIHLERGEEAQLATLADLQLLDPMLSVTGGDRIDPASALAQGHRDFRADLRTAGISEADLLAGPIGRDAVAHQAAFLATQHGDDQVSKDKATYYRARYLHLLTSAVVGAKKPDVVSLDKREQSAQAFNPAKLFYGFGFGGGS
jgi:hypothetical protein